MTTIHTSRLTSPLTAPAPAAKRFPGVLDILKGCLMAAACGFLGWLMIQMPDATEGFVPHGRASLIKLLLCVAWSTPVGWLLLAFSGLVFVMSFLPSPPSKSETA